MPRHVHGMRAGRSDLAIGSRGGERLRRERWIVAGVNNVVHEAGVVGVLRPERLKHGHGLSLLSEAGIGRRHRGQQRQRIEGAGIGVVGMRGVELAHGRRVSIDARLVVLRARPIEIGEAGDVLTLAWRFGGMRLCGFDLAPAGRHRIVVRALPDLVENAHRDAPVGHRAAGIALQDSLELGSCLLVPEVVQQRDAPIEAPLRGGGTGDGKRHRAQALLRDAGCAGDGGRKSKCGQTGRCQ